MEVTWNGGHSVRVVARGANLVLDRSIAFDGGRAFARPGEYDVHGVAVVGVQSRAGAEMNTIFTAHVEGVALCHLGALNEPLTPAQIDAIGPIDVLFLPLGGGPDPLELINALEPKVVVPLPLDPAAAEAFYRQVGQPPEPTAKLSLAADKLPELRKLVALNPPKQVRKAA
jgi:L-ascorbate metabolism protein UlaG (beta-lactamase superfamily)